MNKKATVFNSTGWAKFGAPFTFFSISLILVLSFFGLAGDIDDVVRELQIRDLLSDKNWYDMRLPQISMPDAYFSHYSRFVDLPYYVVTRIFQPFVGQEIAFTYAKVTVPIALLLVFSVSYTRVAQYLAGGKISVVVILSTPFLLFFSILDFAPNRIDHHSLQATLMMLMFWGILMPDKKGGFLVGGAALFSVIVGLECLPFIFAAFSGLIIAAIVDDKLSHEKLHRAGLFLATASVPIGFVLLGGAGFRSVQCDAYSLPWISGATIGGGALILLSWAWSKEWFQNPNPILRKGLSVLILATVVGGILIAFFPTCLSGPYHMIDPISREFWLGIMIQEKSLLSSIITSPSIIVIYNILYFAIAFFVIGQIRVDCKKKQFGIVIVMMVALLALVLAIYQLRFSGFSTIFLSLFLTKIIATASSWTWPRWGVQNYIKHYVIWILPIPLLTIGLFTMRATTERVEPQWNVYSSMHSNDCKGADFSILGDVEPGMIIAPLGVSLNLLDNSYGHKVAATAHHRSAPGIRNVIQVFTTQDTKLRQGILKQFDYVALCAFDQEQLKSAAIYNRSAAPLYLNLASDLQWPGLVPVSQSYENLFRLYRIDRDQMGTISEVK